MEQQQGQKEQGQGQKEQGQMEQEQQEQQEQMEQEQQQGQKEQLKNISPLRYPGGKTRACKKLDDLIQQYFTISSLDHFVSPFFGGGSFEFYFQNKYHKKLIVNDKFVPLYHFWTQVKNNKHMLCDELQKIKKVSKEDFTHYRQTILESTPFEQALQYFIINRCSFSGATLSGGFSEEASNKRFTSSSIERIRKLNLEQVEFYNHDFEYFIHHYVCEKDLLFLDPPYYLQKNATLYGNHGDLHDKFDHSRLFNILNNLRQQQKQQQWIMTYNDCEYIRNLYKEYVILDVNWSYSMNKTKKSSEIVILCSTV